MAAFDIPHRFVETRVLDNPDYRANRPDRCFHCKTELFRVLEALRGTDADRITPLDALALVARLRERLGSDS